MLTKENFLKFANAFIQRYTKAVMTKLTRSAISFVIILFQLFQIIYLVEKKIFLQKILR